MNPCFSTTFPLTSTLSLAKMAKASRTSLKVCLHNIKAINFVLTDKIAINKSEFNAYTHVHVFAYTEGAR